MSLPNQEETGTTSLRRSLSLPLMSLYGLGNILGAGIYVLVGRVAGEAGYLAPQAFLAASIVAGFSAFSYAEMASRYPISAGAAIYVHEGLHSRNLSLLIGLMIIATGVVSAGTMALGFVGYLQVLLDAPATAIIIALLGVLGVIAIWGITQSVITAAIFTVLELVGLLLIAWIAFPEIGNFTELANASSESLGGPGMFGFIAGTYLAFYAFVGFEDMVNVAEEVKRPRRVLPIAIIAALAGATLLYMLIAVSALSVLGPEQLNASDAPLAAVYQARTGGNPWVISVISMLAVVNGALIQIIMASRVAYGAAREGWLPRPLAKLNSVTQTPVLATVIITATIIISALLLPITTLARATTTLLLLIFCLVNLSLVRVKLADPQPENIFRVPMLVPVAGVISSLALLLAQASALLGQ